MEERKDYPYLSKNIPVKDKDFTDLEKKVISNYDKTAIFQVKCKGGEYSNEGSTTCHAVIMNVNRSTFTKFTGNYKMDFPGADKLWDYLATKSPMKHIFEYAPDGWEFLSVDGKVVAFNIPDKVWSFPNQTLVYAFLICSRMPHEKTHMVTAFNKLVSLGIEPNLAYLLCIHLVYQEKEDHFVLSSQAWDGTHKIFVDSYSVMIDTRSWISGGYTDVRSCSLTSRLWNIPGMETLRMIRFPFAKYGEDVKTAFTSTHYIDKKNIPELSRDFERFLERRYENV